VRGEGGGGGGVGSGFGSCCASRVCPYSADFGGSRVKGGNRCEKSRVCDASNAALDCGVSGTPTVGFVGVAATMPAVNRPRVVNTFHLYFMSLLLAVVENACTCILDITF
jgi:hypothetical protein